MAGNGNNSSASKKTKAGSPEPPSISLRVPSPTSHGASSTSHGPSSTSQGKNAPTTPNTSVNEDSSLKGKETGETGGSSSFAPDEDSPSKHVSTGRFVDYTKEDQSESSSSPLKPPGVEPEESNGPGESSSGHGAVPPEEPSSDDDAGPPLDKGKGVAGREDNSGGAAGGTSIAAHGFAMPDPAFDPADNEFIRRRAEERKLQALLSGQDGLEESIAAEVESIVKELQEIAGLPVTAEQRDNIEANIRRLRGGGWLEAAKAQLVNKTEVPIAMFNRLVSEHERTIGYVARRMREFEEGAGKPATEADKGKEKEPKDGEKAAPQVTKEERDEFDRTRREFWATVEQTRRTMGDLQRRVQELYRGFGFTDKPASAEQALERIAARMTDQPKDDVELRLFATKAAVDRSMARMQLDTEKLRSRTLQQKLERARPQSEREHEMRIEYGLFNEEEIERRVDSTTQMYRHQRRDLIDNILGAHHVVTRVSARCAPDLRDELLQARDEYLNLLRLPRPRAVEPRQPRQPGARPGQPGQPGPPAPAGPGAAAPTTPGVSQAAAPTTPGASTAGQGGSPGEDSEAAPSGKTS
ncbi:hypothetical protein F4818DRAFT_283084 [Hypoxylon cercidicola]|nr:hypothetical protein F4818DRAFT_283084 [Hypoxylon cercidicola]